MQNNIASIDRFIQHLTKYVNLSNEDITFITELIPIRTVEKNDFLIREGEVSSEFYYLSEGFVRLYYVQDGEEKTAYFYDKGTFISAYSSFMRQTPCNFYLQATESSSLAVIGLEVSQKLLDYSSKFERLARVAMEEEMVSLQEIIASLLTLRPEERYADLLKRNPEIFQKVPQLQIASYLGVKPESLSRIKKRFMQRS